MRRVVLVGVFLAGCGGAAAKAPRSAEVVKASARPAVPRGSVSRADLLATVNAGLGRFLQRVDVEPRLDAGQFRGFRIVALRPPGYWQGVDLEPGDVVTALNGMPIETEMQAYDAFQSLKRASSIRVSYLRAGRPRELDVPIVGAPPARPARPAKSDAGKARSDKSDGSTAQPARSDAGTVQPATSAKASGGGSG